MKIRMILLVGLCAVLAVPASAQSQVSGLKGDLQCALSAAHLQGSSDPQIRAVGMMVFFFFAGKIFGAAPDIDLNAALEQVAREVRTEPPQAALRRCGKEMEQRGNELQAVGRNLAAKGL